MDLLQDFKIQNISLFNSRSTGVLSNNNSSSLPSAARGKANSNTNSNTALLSYALTNPKNRVSTPANNSRRNSAPINNGVAMPPIDSPTARIRKMISDSNFGPPNSETNSNKALTPTMIAISESSPYAASPPSRQNRPPIPSNRPGTAGSEPGNNDTSAFSKSMQVPRRPSTSSGVSTNRSFSASPTLNNHNLTDNISPFSSIPKSSSTDNFLEMSSPFTSTSKKLKRRVRFSDPIALFEPTPMQNPPSSLTSSSFKSIPSSEFSNDSDSKFPIITSSPLNELKSALKGSSSPIQLLENNPNIINSNYVSSNNINSAINSIHTMNNTINNKTIILNVTSEHQILRNEDNSQEGVVKRRSISVDNSLLSPSSSFKSNAEDTLSKSSVNQSADTDTLDPLPAKHTINPSNIRSSLDLTAIHLHKLSLTQEATLKGSSILPDVNNCESNNRESNSQKIFTRLTSSENSNPDLYSSSLNNSSTNNQHTSLPLPEIIYRLPLKSINMQHITFNQIIPASSRSSFMKNNASYSLSNSLFGIENSENTLIQAFFLLDHIQLIFSMQSLINTPEAQQLYNPEKIIIIPYKEIINMSLMGTKFRIKLRTSGSISNANTSEKQNAITANSILYDLNSLGNDVNISLRRQPMSTTSLNPYLTCNMSSAGEKNVIIFDVISSIQSNTSTDSATTNIPYSINQYLSQATIFTANITNLREKVIPLIGSFQVSLPLMK